MKYQIKTDWCLCFCHNLRHNVAPNWRKFRCTPYILQTKRLCDGSRKNKMATFAYVDIKVDAPEVQELADLYGVCVDLSLARNMANSVKAGLDKDGLRWPHWAAYSLAIAMMYCRPFVQGVIKRLGQHDIEFLTQGDRGAHDRLLHYRNKHVAHSVNEFEDNRPRAYYCAERVSTEGITSIGYEQTRVATLTRGDLDNVIKLTTLIENQVKSKMSELEKHVLAIVRESPLGELLSAGSGPSKVDTNARIDKSRKGLNEDRNGRT